MRLLDTKSVITEARRWVMQLSDTNGAARASPHRGVARRAVGLPPKRPRQPSSTVTKPDCCTPGGFHEPSRIDGGVSLGQYKRNIRMNLPVGAGSQFDSLFAPGDACWM